MVAAIWKVAVLPTAKVSHVAARLPAVESVVAASPPVWAALTKVSPDGRTSVSATLKAVVLLAPVCDSATVNVTGSPASPPVGTADFTTCSVGSTIVTFGALAVAVPPVKASDTALFRVLPRLLPAALSTATV